jgi:hypothetical protein
VAGTRPTARPRAGRRSPSHPRTRQHGQEQSLLRPAQIELDAIAQDPQRPQDLYVHRRLPRPPHRGTGAPSPPLGRTGPAGRPTIAALQAWFAAAMEALHHHHTIEDDIMWPALRERSGAFADADALKQAEHEALDAAMTAAAAAVMRLSTVAPTHREAARRDAEEQVVRLRAVLVEHLDDEDDRLPLLGEAFTVEEHRELAARVHDQFSPKELAFGLCWYLDAATPRERAAIVSELPRPVRLLQRRYERLAAVLPPLWRAEDATLPSDRRHAARGDRGRGQDVGRVRAAGAGAGAGRSVDRSWWAPRI